MEGLTRSEAIEVLAELHRRLDSHFCALHKSRREQGSHSPVFALEHGLSAADLDTLLTGVRHAVAKGFDARLRQWWLPFVVYAAESGYDYVGDEYWLSFEQATPGWQSEDRHWIKAWFQKFSEKYGGAVPTGAFARNFSIISWPITHAVLPIYLQRNLAQLLFEFRMGLTTQLLGDPRELGKRLAMRSGSYTERFRVFCENTTLLGHVAAALLSGEDEESPYLLRSTLLRLINGLSRERESRHWLASARQSASRVRARGFRHKPRRSTVAARMERLPAPTDPRLLLRPADYGWRAYAELPDLSALNGRLPHVYDELRTLRARISGAQGTMLARGRLLFSGQQIRLTSWPRPDMPFIQLERGSVSINGLIAEQCVLTKGPAWLFRHRASGVAVEVKQRIVHPGSSYVLVIGSTLAIPDVPWITETPIQVEGVRAYDVTVPQSLTEDDIAALSALHISVISDVAVRPVGVVPSRWDGEGSVEWLAGEPGLIGIYTERTPRVCVVTVDGQRYTIDWPGQQRELLVTLDTLTVGTYVLTATLLDDNVQKLAEGSLIVTIRDPQVRPDGATAGEGIRMLASPARPSLSDLWDGRASISIDGPPSTSADLTVILRSETGTQLAEIHRSVALPMTTDKWSNLARRIRDDQRFLSNYDEAESADIVISRSEIGFASLTCDRGFQPLRWRVVRSHEGSHAARLIDRTDKTNTRAELFEVDTPTRSVTCDPGADIAVPPQGGLLRAIAGEARSAVLLPTQPNELIRGKRVRPFIETKSTSPGELLRLAEAHHLWATADQTADAFARRQLDIVLKAITSAFVSTVAGRYWANLERRLATANNMTDYLDEMERCVGVSDSHRVLAREIALNLWNWLTPGALITGFAEVVASTIKNSGIVGQPSTARLLLTLAACPGDIVGYNAGERDDLLAKIIASPVLLRAARFAVLGTHALNEAERATGAFQ